MLSAIEAFGPPPGPTTAAARIHAHPGTAYHQHPNSQHLIYLQQRAASPNLIRQLQPLSSPASISPLSNGKLSTAATPTTTKNAVQSIAKQTAMIMSLSASDFARSSQCNAPMSLDSLTQRSSQYLKNFCSSSEARSSYLIEQAAPINLATSTASANIGVTASAAYQRRSPAEAPSSLVDVDGKECVMLSVTRSAAMEMPPPAKTVYNQSVTPREPSSGPLIAATSMTPFSCDYSHLYVTRAALYGAAPPPPSQLFTSHPTHLQSHSQQPASSLVNPMDAALRHPAYLAGPGGAMPMPSTNMNSFSLAYLKAMQQAVVAGIFGHGPQSTSCQPPLIPHPSLNTGSSGNCVPTHTANEPGHDLSPNAIGPSVMTSSAILALGPQASSFNHAPTPLIMHNSFISTGASGSQVGLSSPSDLRSRAQKSVVAATVPLTPPPSSIKKESVASFSGGGGTFLYDRSNTSSGNTEEDCNYFKVPNGKEGSMKHRILTRPSPLVGGAPSNIGDVAVMPLPVGDKCTINKPAMMRTHDSTTNFQKGSYIELAHGAYRKVEDMRTEDFIKCAERSLHHQLVESTVVKINGSESDPNQVLITFSYDKNRSMADIDVVAEHPFFVYGQGWASCHPDLSLRSFGLKCQRLQVGDICISLSRRESAAIEKTRTTASFNSQQSTILSSAPLTTTISDNTAHGSRYTGHGSTTKAPLSPLPSTTKMIHLPLSSCQQYTHQLHRNALLQQHQQTLLYPYTAVTEMTEMLALGPSQQHLYSYRNHTHSKHPFMQTSGVATPHHVSSVQNVSSCVSSGLYVPSRMLQETSLPCMPALSSPKVFTRGTLPNCSSPYTSPFPQNSDVLRDNRLIDYDGETDGDTDKDVEMECQPVIDASVNIDDPILADGGRKRRWSAPESSGCDDQRCDNPIGTVAYPSPQSRHNQNSKALCMSGMLSV